MQTQTDLFTSLMPNIVLVLTILPSDKISVIILSLNGCTAFNVDDKGFEHLSYLLIVCEPIYFCYPSYAWFVVICCNFLSAIISERTCEPFLKTTELDHVFV